VVSMTPANTSQPMPCSASASPGGQTAAGGRLPRCLPVAVRLSLGHAPLLGGRCSRRERLDAAPRTRRSPRNPPNRVSSPGRPRPLSRRAPSPASRRPRGAYASSSRPAGRFADGLVRDDRRSCGRNLVGLRREGVPRHVQAPRDLAEGQCVGSRPSTSERRPAGSEVWPEIAAAENESRAPTTPRFLLGGRPRRARRGPWRSPRRSGRRTWTSPGQAQSGYDSGRGPRSGCEFCSIGRFKMAPDCVARFWSILPAAGRCCC